MKKLIALVLSMVMVLALFTVGTNAASFSDGATITSDYKEAVDIMASLGVLQGKENKKFAPKDTLTRAEAAKIITYLLLGSESADKLTNDTPVFDDVAVDFWGAPYIAFCVSEGIVNGNGDGTFTPDGKLTGFAFAKMLLGAVKFGGNYTGAAWELAVLEDAKKTEKKSENGKGLLELLEEINLGADIPREQASQMAFNALFFSSKDASEYSVKINNGNAALESAVKDKTFATIKELSAFLQSCGIDLKENHNNSIYTVIDSSTTLAEENFDVHTLDGYIVRNGGMSLDKFTTVRDDNNVDHKFNFTTGTAQFGHYVTVYYKDEWTWEKGDTDNDLKGVTYTYIDQTIPIAVGKNNMTTKEVKDLLGVKEIDDTAIKHYHYFYDYDYNVINNYPFSPFTHNEKETQNWDVTSGTMLLRENENDERYIDGFVRGGSIPMEFFIDVVDPEREIYNVTVQYSENPVIEDEVVKMDAEDPADNFDKTLPDSYGNVIDWADYINNKDGLPNYNSKETGEAILFVTRIGELYQPTAISKTVGKIDKVKLIDKYDGNSKIWINGTEYTISDSLSYKAYYEKLGQGKATFLIESAANRRPQLNKALDISKEYTFYFRGSTPVAFAEVNYDSKLIIPTKFYSIDTLSNEADVDDYGDGVDQEDRYEYYVQGVDMGGNEIKLPVAWDYDTNTGSRGNSACTFLKEYVSGGKGYTDEGVPVSNGSAQFAVDDKALRESVINSGVKTYVPCIYTYTMEKDEHGKEYAHFERVIDKANSAYEDPDGAYSIEVVTTALDVTKDTKRVRLNNSYLMGSGDYTVLMINDDGGKDLRIKTATNAYSQIGTYTVLYGEKDKNETTSNYTLKTALNMKSSLSVASDEMIFVGTDFNSENKTSVTYTDKNNREKTVTAYEQYVFINGEGKWILTTENSGVFAGNLYEFEVNEYSGLYEKFSAYHGDDWYTGISKLEDNYGMISFGDEEDLRDCDVSGATVINTTDYNVKSNLSALADDEKHTYYVAVKCDDDEEVETVYVYGIRTALDIKYNGKVVENEDEFYVSTGSDAVFSFKDKNSAQGIVAKATKNGSTYEPVIDSSAKTLTFKNMASGTYEVKITVNESKCASQVLTFTLQVGGPV